MQQRYLGKRSQLLERDETRLSQPKHAPDLEIGTAIQCAFKYSDEDADDGDNDILEWCTGTVTRVSDGKNIRTMGNEKNKFYKKGGAVEIQWHADESKGEDISYSIVTTCKGNFNKNIETSWRLYFNVPWNIYAIANASSSY